MQQRRYGNKMAVRWRAGKFYLVAGQSIPEDHSSGGNFEKHEAHSEGQEPMKVFVEIF